MTDARRVTIGSFRRIPAGAARPKAREPRQDRGRAALQPVRRLTFYGGDIYALLRGPPAPLGLANTDEVFPRSVARRHEHGIRVRPRRRMTLGGLQHDLAEHPDGPVDEDLLGDGKQRNRVRELTAFGGIVGGIRVLVGASRTEARAAERRLPSGGGAMTRFFTKGRQVQAERTPKDFFGRAR